jgi:hypothetical protein
VDVHIDCSRKTGEPAAVDRLIGTDRCPDVPDDTPCDDDVGAPSCREHHVPEHEIGGHLQHTARSSRFA